MTDTEISTSSTLVFSGGLLIDGVGQVPVSDSVVVVTDSRITAAGARTEIPIPEEAEIIELEGKSILPGLIDAHVHIGNIDISMYKTAELSPAVYVHRATQNLETALDLGFTTIRDAGGLDAGFREAIEQGLIRGPRLFLSVSPLTPTGGHFDMRRPHQTAIIPRNAIGIFPEICDGPDAVRRSAREVIRRGADQVKVAADGGVDSPTDRPGCWQFSIDELKAAVETAEAAGRYVMAHAYASKPIRHCLEAGVRTIEHGNLLDAPTAAMIADCGAYFVPTLTVYDIFANEAKEKVDDFARRKLHLVHEAGRQALEHALKAGAKIGSGSDIIGPYHHLMGREFRLKTEVMTPMQAILSATRINAEIVGAEDEIGTLEPGKSADLIVVEGDPLADPSILENGLETVLLVMKAGRVMKNRLTPFGSRP